MAEACGEGGRAKGAQGWLGGCTPAALSSSIPCPNSFRDWKKERRSNKDHTATFFRGRFFFHLASPVQRQLACGLGNAQCRPCRPLLRPPSTTTPLPSSLSRPRRPRLPPPPPPVPSPPSPLRPPTPTLTSTSPPSQPLTRPPPTLRLQTSRLKRTNWTTCKGFRLSTDG